MSALLAPQYGGQTSGGGGSAAAAAATPQYDSAAASLAADADYDRRVTARAARRALPGLVRGKPHGECLARASVRALLFRAWRPAFFVFEKPQVLLLFRTEADYFEWHKNPHLDKECREYLVKKAINLTHTARCSPVTAKGYRKVSSDAEAGRFSSLSALAAGLSPFAEDRSLLHFTLEELRPNGKLVVAKFASTDSDTLKELREAIHDSVDDLREQRERCLNAAPAAGAAGGGRPQRWEDVV